jgi:hypothetical protein
MLQRFTSRLPAIAMAGLLILGVSERAHADLAVSITGNTPPSAIATTGDVPGNGATSFTLTSGIFTTSGNAFGATSGFVAPPVQMDLGTSTVSSTGAGTATIVFSQNNLTAPVGMGTIFETISAHVTSSGSVGVVYSTFGSNANTLFGTATNPTAGAGQASLTTTFTSTPTGATATGAFTATSPYSLTETLVLTFSGAGSVLVSLSSDSSAGFTAIPEPSTMAIAGLGSLGFIAYGLRRRKASGA